MADEEDDKEGRPQDRGQARREAFLAAAREVFLRRGYRAASVNEVVRIAGGSLATLYQQFGNKEGLFHAFVLDQHARFTADMAPESVDHLELEDGLRAIGVRYLSNLLKPDTLAFYRLVVSEGMQFPEDARRDVSAGAGDVRKLVSDFLRARGGPADESARHPDMLLELWRSRYHMRAIIDGGRQPQQAQAPAPQRAPRAQAAPRENPNLLGGRGDPARQADRGQRGDGQRGEWNRGGDGRGQQADRGQRGDGQRGDWNRGDDRRGQQADRGQRGDGQRGDWNRGGDGRGQQADRGQRGGWENDRRGQGARGDNDRRGQGRGDWNRDGRRDFASNHRDSRRDDRRYDNYRHTHRDFSRPRYSDWRNVRHGHYFDRGYVTIVHNYYGWNYHWWGYDGWRRPYRIWSVGYALPHHLYWEPVPYDLYYRLPPAPYGCRYVMVDRDVLLVVVATGVILDALMYY